MIFLFKKNLRGKAKQRNFKKMQQLLPRVVKVIIHNFSNRKCDEKQTVTITEKSQHVGLGMTGTRQNTSMTFQEQIQRKN